MSRWLQKHVKLFVWSLIVLIAIYIQQGFQFAVVATSFLIANYFNSILLWNEFKVLQAQSKTSLAFSLVTAVLSNLVYLLSLDASLIFYFLVWVIPILGFIFFFFFKKYKDRHS